LGKLQGAWEVMGADLMALNKLFSEQGITIPPMLLEQLQLNQIIEQWNTLKGYGTPHHPLSTTRTLLMNRVEK